MKKLILSLALCCAATNFFAQNADPAQLVNEGKAALESKNYQVAFTKFSTYLTQTNNQDSVIAFKPGNNTARLGRALLSAAFALIKLRNRLKL